MIIKNFRHLFSLVLIAFIGLNSCTDSENTPETRGSIVNVTLKGTYTTEELKAKLEAAIPGISLLFPINNGIDAYQVVYNTIAPDGSPTICSGIFAIPKVNHDTVDLPMVSYQHGTVVEKSDAPSVNGTEGLIPMALAGTGYIALASDYLGLGLGPGFHPYIQSRSEASAVIDMLRTVRNYCKENDIPYNDKLFLFGYSQGGHSTMAAQKEIETNYSKEFKLTAVAPMSGPYSISGVMKDLMLSKEPYPTPNYLPYLLLTYHKYDGLYNSPSDFFIAPFDSLMPALFDGTHSSGQIDALLPSAPIDIVKPEVIESFLLNPYHPLHRILEENDTYNFSPKAPITMYYCTGDTQVKYTNAIVAQDYFTSIGISNTQAILNGPGDHDDCVIPSFLKAKLWFDTFLTE